MSDTDKTLDNNPEHLDESSVTGLAERSPVAIAETPESDAVEPGDEATPDTADQGAPAAGADTPASNPAPRSSRPPRHVNPVLWREARTRFESRRTAWLVLAYLVVLGGIVALVYTSTINGGGTTPAVTRLGATGREVFETTLVVTALLIMMLVPPQAASTITGERERQTLMPMQITLLRPLQIVLGKLSAAVMFTILLITLTAPVLAIGYVIGGVTITNVVVGVALLIVIAALTSTIAVWWSSVARRSTTAIVLTMFSLFVLVGGTGFAYTAVYSIAGGFSRTNPDATAPAVLLGPNPLMALADAVGESEGVVTFDEWGNEVFGGPLTWAKQAMISSSGGYSGRDVFFEGPMPPVTIAIGDGGVEGDDGDFSGSADDMMSLDVSAGAAMPDEVIPDEVMPDDVVTSMIEVEFDEAGGMAVTVGGTVASDQMVAIDPNTGMPIDPERLDGGGSFMPLWAQFLIFSGLIMVLSTWGASRRLRTPANTER